MLLACMVNASFQLMGGVGRVNGDVAKERHVREGWEADRRQDEIADLEGVVQGGLELGDSTLGTLVVMGREARSHLDEEAGELRHAVSVKVGVLAEAVVGTRSLDGAGRQSGPDGVGEAALAPSERVVEGGDGGISGGEVEELGTRCCRSTVESLGCALCRKNSKPKSGSSGSRVHYPGCQRPRVRS